MQERQNGRGTTSALPELLAPAGGPAAFDAALAGGADAIYVGFGNDFNARRSAENFTDESFAEACRKAHLAGSRVYVTTNVVIKTEEMARALALVRHAWLLGADAFIVQDLGLLFELHRRWPQIEVHASTQMNVHDARGVCWAAAQGVDRVTLSRELSVAEIAEIAKTGVELEGFGHGALCFCYSGICLMSSLGGTRSANRGMCAQPCRLLYQLLDGEGRVLSPAGNERALCPKDYCTIDHLDELRAAGLGSLKIEGRMKAPDYVFAVSSAYRGELDALAHGDDTPEAAEERREWLRRAFNRDFTHAYLYGRSGNDMMSYERSNNRGELVGEVVATRDLGGTRVRRGGTEGGRERFRHVTRAEVTVRLDKHVGKGDLLEVRPVADPSQFLTALADEDAGAGEVITCKVTRPMPVGSPVRVIRSQRALDAAGHVATAVPRKRPVQVSVVARLGEPFVVELSCSDRYGRHAVGRAEGFVVEAARTRAVTAGEIREHVERMGQSAFEPVSYESVCDEGVGMSFSAVHKVRAKACQALEQSILAPYEERGEGLASTPDLEDISAGLKAVALKRTGSASRVGTGGENTPPQVCVLAPTPEIARSAQGAGAERVYATVDDLASGSWPEGVVPWLDEVCREIDRGRLDPWVSEGAPVAVGNVSELALATERGACAEVRTTIPVHNSSALAALEAAGAKGVWLTGELSLAEVRSLAQASHMSVGLVVYGRDRAMTSEHCVLQVAGRCKGDCANCALRGEACALRTKDGELMPVRTDIHGRSRIYAAQPLDATPQMGELIDAGVSRVMVDATLLSAEETAHEVGRVIESIAAIHAGRRPAPREDGATSGHLFAPIV